MVNQIICTFFAVCGMSELPTDGHPTWGSTSPVAVPLVARWEGVGPTYACDASDEGICARAYLDTIAEPDIWTVCYGHTDDVSPGDTYTIEACRTLLSATLRTYWAGWRVALEDDAPLTVPRDAAFTSLAYNVGVGGVRRSTALRRLNAGDVAGACEAITWWNRAGGRVIRGLVNRRADEYRLCMEGVE